MVMPWAVLPVTAAVEKTSTVADQAASAAFAARSVGPRDSQGDSIGGNGDVRGKLRTRCFPTFGGIRPLAAFVDLGVCTI